MAFDQSHKGSKTHDSGHHQNDILSQIIDNSQTTKVSLTNCKLQYQILGPNVNEQESFSKLWNIFNVRCGETRWCAMRRAQDAAKNWRAPLNQVSIPSGTSLNQVAPLNKANSQPILRTTIFSPTLSTIPSSCQSRIFQTYFKCFI